MWYKDPLNMYRGKQMLMTTQEWRNKDGANNCGGRTAIFIRPLLETERFYLLTYGLVYSHFPP
jgi:hypothetical protein